MSNSDHTAQLLQLLDALCNDTLTDEQRSRLQRLLRNDSAAQRTYLEYVDLHLGLKHLLAAQSGGASPIERPNVTTPVSRATRNRSRATAALAAGLLVAAAAVLVALFVPPPHIFTPSEPRTTESVPQITRLEGGVQVYSVDGMGRDATIGMTLGEGERIETAGPGVAVLSYEDGTRLTLVNDCSVTRPAAQRKSVMLHHGILSAEVAQQPSGQPMLLATPGARVEVLGTRFAVAATTDRTELNVAEGRVRLTRVSDGQTVEVAQGQGVVTNGEVRLTVRDSDAARDTWGADFEAGVPKGWTGAHVRAGLPADSRGAIRAIAPHENEPNVFVISTREQWVSGLFEIHADSHLHITMKMEHPDWLNVFFSSRDSDATLPKWTLHNFNEVPFWPPKPGRWQTVTIPLSKFRSKRDGVFHDVPPAAGDVAYELAITSTGPERGLVVDRIWVTRGGPGKVEARPLP